jgi:lipopolysaccharide/colanic/teichoic acid biosynthesis glycosyltransferase
MFGENAVKIRKPPRRRRLYCHEDMLFMLERERARADRSGQEFSLAMFDFRTRTARDGVLVKLVHVLIQRSRSTDVIGWMGGWRIGVLLPDTPADGARKLIADVYQALADSFHAPECSVYSYPLQKHSAGNGGAEIKQDRTNVPYTDVLDAAQKHPNWKRGMDMLIALLVLILLSPLLIIIALVIKLSSPGPVFFKQERLGYLGRPFICWKFRTMNADSDKTPHEQYLEKLIRENIPMTKLDAQDDPRILPFGKFLRQTYLDELPQLINVLLGDMSLVGPRPCLAYEAKLYQPWYNGRFDAVPGMTGLWQVSGKNNMTFKDMIRLDISYVRNRSLWLDLEILAKTVPFILKQIH